MSAENTMIVRHFISERHESRPLAQCRSPDGVQPNPGTSFSRLHLGYVLITTNFRQRKES